MYGLETEGVPHFDLEFWTRESEQRRATLKARKRANGKMKLILLGRENWKKTESLLNMPEVSAWGRSVSCLIASSYHT